MIVDEKLDDLARQVTRKMLSYALGRQLEYYDEPTVRKILLAFKKDGHRMQTAARSERELPVSLPQKPGECRFRKEQNRS